MQRIICAWNVCSNLLIPLKYFKHRQLQVIQRILYSYLKISRMRLCGYLALTHFWTSDSLLQKGTCLVAHHGSPSPSSKCVWLLCDYLSFVFIYHNFKYIFECLCFIPIHLNHVSLFLHSSHTFLVSSFPPKTPPRFCQLFLYFSITKLVAFIFVAVLSSWLIHSLTLKVEKSTK